MKLTSSTGCSLENITASQYVTDWPMASSCPDVKHATLYFGSQIWVYRDYLNNAMSMRSTAMLGIWKSWYVFIGLWCGAAWEPYWCHLYGQSRSKLKWQVFFAHLLQGVNLTASLANHDATKKKKTLTEPEMQMY